MEIGSDVRSPTLGFDQWAKLKSSPLGSISMKKKRQDKPIFRHGWANPNATRQSHCRSHNAEQAGACCLIVLDPSQRDISCMPDPSLIKEMKSIVSIPIMVSARVGHFVKAQILEAIRVDYIDESEAIALADEDNFINKHNFRCPFVCGCENHGEALSKVREGAAMIRIQGDLSGSENVTNTIKNMRIVMGQIRILNNLDEE
ncbi:hypothetical protein SO802_031656 [Lithocarpus litseifolius]|uniref:PdxS/SNZ N-terminal domain-containing protein n=1 Tax=Lithocarpus litseifolius TaxID=425828 RepID=A0AAW2BL28_9ROSI